MSRADLLAALRRRLAETRDTHREPPMTTLDELADRNPALKARVDTLRQALPAPPTKEPEASE